MKTAPFIADPTRPPGAEVFLEPGRAARPFGRAWLFLAGALALHVADEALNDFLSIYNPMVEAIRHRLPWLPLPVFSFGEWIAGLALLIALLLALAPLAYRPARWVVAVAFPLAVIMILNGLLHLGGLLYTGRFLPGVYSSPILLAAAVWLLISAIRVLRRQNRSI
jgi:hypothetical protein